MLPARSFCTANPCFSTDDKEGGRSGLPRKGRIETQIHRRKKAKAVLPLESEWQSDSATPPLNLRMPSSTMAKIRECDNTYS